MTGRFVTRKLKRTQSRRRKGALVGAVLAVGSVSMAATIAPPAGASSVPTASINVWWASGGTDLDNLWASMIKSFESSTRETTSISSTNLSPARHTGRSS